jgi:tartrate dehydrogenase/decarboxylase/D-malate dehydrogenase
MMLEFLGQEKAAQELMQAIETVTGSGTLTPDLGGNAGTTEFTDQVIARLSVQQ